MAAYNDQEFAAEHKINESVRRLATVLSTVQVAGNRILPLEAGSPLQILLDDLRIAPVEAAPVFEFELDDNLSIRQAELRCQNRQVNGIPAPVQFLDYVQSRIGRAYFNITMNALNPNWVELSRPEAADCNYEAGELMFLDSERKTIDWSLSLPKLKVLANDRKYTPAMMKKSLLRIVNQFHPDQSNIIQDYTADQIAVYLLRLDSKRDKAVFYKDQLFRVVRTPQDDLQAPLAKAQVLIDRIYPAANADMGPYRSTAYKVAVVSFLPDELAIPLIERIRESMARCEPMTDEEIFLRALRMEDYSRIRPLSNLQYGRKISRQTASSLVSLNNTETAPVSFQRSIDQTSGFSRQFYSPEN